MKTPTILVGLLVVTAFWLTPNQVDAAAAMQLNDTTVLFTLNFGSTAAGDDYQLPIMASSTVGYFDRVDVLGYALTGADVMVTNAVLLSNQPVVGERYTIDADEQASFTLLIIATLSGPLTSDLTASFTKIPYWIGERRTTVHENQLNELETATLQAS